MWILLLLVATASSMVLGRAGGQESSPRELSLPGSIADKLVPGPVQFSAAPQDLSGEDSMPNSLPVVHRAAGALKPVPGESVTTIGSGFFLDGQGTMVTVIANPPADTKVIVGYEGGSLNGKILALDPKTRVALVKLDGLKTPPLKLAESESLKVSEELFVLRLNKNGIPQRELIGCLAGREKAVRGMLLPLTLLRCNLKGDPGTFGTPLLNARGKVVAILVTEIERDQHYCYALPAEAIQKVRDDLDAFGEIKSSWLGMKIEMGTTTPRVEGLREHSPAYEGGIREGDVIRSIGGRDITDYHDVLNAMYYLQVGKKTSVVVLRGLRELELSVLPKEGPVSGGPVSGGPVSEDPVSGKGDATVRPTPKSVLK